MKRLKFPLLFLLIGGLVLNLYSCKRAKLPVAEERVEDEEVLEPITADLAAEAVFLQGDVFLIKDRQESPLELGQVLEPGDIVRTAPYASAEFSLGTAGSIRLLPETQWRLDGSVGANMSLLKEGIALIKLRKLKDIEQISLSTPSSVMGVRGTSFMVQADKTGRTILAVQEGAVAMLPASPLVKGIVDGSVASAKSRAVLTTALNLAARVEAGQELEQAAAVVEADIDMALGELLIHAEELRVDWSHVSDADIQLEESIGAQERESFKKLLAWESSKPLSEENKKILELLPHLREPGQEDWLIPAALPMERIYPPKVEKKPAVDSALAWTTKLSAYPIADPLTRVGNVIIARTQDGSVHAVDEAGSILWQDRGKSEAVTALPDAVALVSAGNIRILDPKTGRERGGWSSETGTSNDSSNVTSTSKPVPVPEGLAMLTPRGIAVVRAENAALIREIIIPGGFSSAPVLAGRELVVMSASGELLIIDVEGGQVKEKMPTPLSGPCLLPRWADPVLLLASRAGTVISVDLENRLINWERSLKKTLNGDIEVGEGNIYLQTQDSLLYIIDIDSGADAVRPLSKVDSPPLLASGVLYYGTDDGKIIALNPKTLAVIRSIDIGEAVSVRPILLGENLYAGTRTGRIIRINKIARP